MANSSRSSERTLYATPSQRLVLSQLKTHNDEKGSYRCDDGNRRRTLESLERRGLVRSDGRLWWVTDKGRRYA